MGEADTIKVTVDATAFIEHNGFGFGMVARDYEGELVKAKVVSKQGNVPAELAKVMTIKEALSWIKEEAWGKVQLESDCLVAVQAIRSKVVLVSPFGQVVEECRCLLKELNKIDLFFIKRSANMAAQHLARGSFSFLDRVFDRGMFLLIL